MVSRTKAVDGDMGNVAAVHGGNYVVSSTEPVAGHEGIQTAWQLGGEGHMVLFTMAVGCNAGNESACATEHVLAVESGLAVQWSFHGPEIASELIVGLP